MKNSKFFYTNADSLLNKFDELNMRLSCDQFDIVCITEVKPKYNRYGLNISEIQIDGYNVFSNMDSIGRGVVIYVNKQLKATVTDNIQIQCNDVLLLSLQLNGADEVILGCIYRSPNSSQDFNVKLNRMIIELSQKKKKSAIDR